MYFMGPRIILSCGDKFKMMFFLFKVILALFEIDFLDHLKTFGVSVPLALHMVDNIIN